MKKNLKKKISWHCPFKYTCLYEKLNFSNSTNNNEQRERIIFVYRTLPLSQIICHIRRDQRGVSVKTEVVGTQRVQMKGVLPCLIRSGCFEGTRYFYPTLAGLVGLIQSIFFLIVHFFISFHLSPLPSTWAGCHAGSPVSQCVCLAISLKTFKVQIPEH